MAARLTDEQARALGIDVPEKQRKYKAKPQTIDGIKFPSKKEAHRYVYLRQRERRGEITRLQCHQRFQLTVNGRVVGLYEADFTYYEDGRRVVEDVKGMRQGVPYRLFKLKANLMRAIYGVEVKEI